MLKLRPERGAGVIQERMRKCPVQREEIVRRERGWEGGGVGGKGGREREREKKEGVKGSRKESEKERAGERNISKQRIEMHLEWLGLVQCTVYSFRTSWGGLCVPFPTDYTKDPQATCLGSHQSPGVTVQLANNVWCSGLRREGGD